MADFELTLGWVIVYVDDPAETAAFYERVFGLRVEFGFETYAQMDTGATKLGFAAHETQTTHSLGDDNFPGGDFLGRSVPTMPAWGLKK